MSANLTDITAPGYAMHNNSSTTADSPAVAATPSSPFRFVLYSTCFDNNPTPGEEASFEAFVGQVVEDGHRRDPHKDGAAFSPVTYRSGTTRALANVDQVCAVPLDVEHVTPVRTVKLFEDIAGLEFLAYTTHSHTEEDPRWRIVIALTRPVPARLYPRLWEKIVQMVGADAVDPSTRDASRLFYLPAAKDGAPAELKYNSGPGVITLDPVEVLELTEDQFAAALAQSTAAQSLVPSTPPINIVDGLIEKTGLLAQKTRPTADDLKACVLAAQPNQYRPNIEALFADLPFATAGGRDAAAHGCASTIAFVAPEADVEDIAQLFEKSVAAMWAANTSTSNPPPTMDEIRSKVRRAINRRREIYYQDLDFMNAAHAATSTSAGPPAQKSLAPVLDPAARYGLAGEIVATIEPHSEASPAALLLQLLVAFGNLLGRGPHFRVGPDQHHMNFFSVLVGPSSKGRKGTSWSWIYMLLMLVDVIWAGDRVRGGLSSGEGLVYEVRDAVEKFDPDAKQMVVIDEGVLDKRLMVVEPELASGLEAANRQGNNLSPTIRQAWDTGKLGTMTKGNRTKATGALISIIGHITANELRRKLSATEMGNGFANRFLYAYVERSKCLPEGGSLTEDDLRPLALRLQQVAAFAKTVGEVKRDEPARALWWDIYPELSKGEDSLVGAVTSRGEAQVVRLAVMYALLDRSALVRLEHLQAALALWKYCEASCRYIFGDRIGDPLADEILQALRAEPGGLTRTEITRRVFQGHKSTVEIGAALETLVRQGLAVRTASPSTGGRPGELWRAVDTSITATAGNAANQPGRAS